MRRVRRVRRVLSTCFRRRGRSRSALLLQQARQRYQLSPQPPPLMTPLGGADAVHVVLGGRLRLRSAGGVVFVPSAVVCCACAISSAS